GHLNRLAHQAVVTLLQPKPDQLAQRIRVIHGLLARSYRGRKYWLASCCDHPPRPGRPGAPENPGLPGTPEKPGIPGIPLRPGVLGSDNVWFLLNAKAPLLLSNSTPPSNQPTCSPLREYALVPLNHPTTWPSESLTRFSSRINDATPLL